MKIPTLPTWLRPSRHIKGDVKSFVRWREGSKCAECGVTISETGGHMAHVFANAKGGGTSMWNIYLSCEPCNYAAGTSLAIPRTWRKIVLFNIGYLLFDEVFDNLMDLHL